MAFAGNCGINIQISDKWKSKFQSKDTENDAIEAYFPLLFSEELGFILEVLDTDIEQVNVSISMIIFYFINITKFIHHHYHDHDHRHHYLIIIIDNIHEL